MVWRATLPLVFTRHNVVYDKDPELFIKTLGEFLGLIGKIGMKAGFVFFDDCWGKIGWAVLFAYISATLLHLNLFFLKKQVTSGG